MATLGLRSCVARQEPYIPGALSILQGTVPGRARGLGHMVPTYFRRELRDRALQRHLRLRTFVCRDRHTREGGYPVRRGFAILALTSPEYWIARFSRVTTAECDGACPTISLMHRKPSFVPRRWPSARR